MLVGRWHFAALWKNFFGKLGGAKHVSCFPFAEGQSGLSFFSKNKQLPQSMPKHYQYRNWEGSEAARAQSCFCSLLLFPIVYLYFFHSRMYILYSICNICLSIVTYVQTVKCCIHWAFSVTLLVCKLNNYILSYSIYSGFSLSEN